MSGGRPCILVAEDSLVVRALVRKQLELRGYDVIEAVDGQQALELARASDPDTILIDVDMPKLTGYQVLEQLKQDPATAGIPVVFLTGRTDAEDAIRALDLGAHDYLRKPFEGDELAARVQAAVRVKHLQDRMRDLNADLTRQATTDGLTGVANRRELDDQLARCCSRAARHASTLGVLLIDVDHFKRINDDHGHEAGDVALVEIANRIGQRLRREDILGRWGGEEFMVITPDVGGEGPAALAEDLRECIAGQPLQVGGRYVPVTVSVGWAAWNGDDPRTLVRRADEALYRAKNAGRNRVVGNPENASRAAGPS